ncbi:MAG TPA: hypothetical protein VN451_06450 [Chitinophagaceae bacterium]|nr:hypothetical protein [Chitinophagaceae bacterium]
MKKFFAIALIAVSVAACNNSGDKKEGEDKDTTKTEVPVTPTPADSVATPADSTAKPADSTATQPK